MKRMISVLLCLSVLTALLCVPAPAETAEPKELGCGDYQYVLLPDGTAEIRSYFGNEDELIIPDSLNGTKVTAIGDGVFSSRRSLVSVFIPDSVTAVGANPFVHCIQLSAFEVSPDHPALEVIDGVLFSKADHRLISYPMSKTGQEYTVPQGTALIGDDAFSYSIDLTSISIPDSVTAVGVNPFVHCISLSSFTVSPDHPALEIIDGVLFSKADHRLISYPMTKADRDYAIPQGTALIGDRAFSHCSDLASVTIPDSVTVIGNSAFEHCSGLDSVSIPGSVTAIGDSAFAHCISLDSVSIPNGITVIGDYAFSLCYSLMSVSIPDSVTAIGNGAFFGCDSLMSVSIPDSVTAVGTNPFVCCESLSSVRVSPDHPALAVMDGVLFSKADKRLICYPISKTDRAYAIPQGVARIGDHAFDSCAGLAAVSIPDSVTAIGNSAFIYCTGLTDLTIPDGVSVIGNYAFDSCERLESISLPGSVAAIGNGAFRYCYSLASISIPDSVTAVGSNPFMMCRSLADISVSPDHPALTVMDGVLFSKADHRLICYPMAKTERDYTIPQGVTQIGDNAFYHCSVLASLSIPDSVVFIGRNALKTDFLLTVTVPRNSCAARYCRDNKLNYTYADAQDWLSR